MCNGQCVWEGTPVEDGWMSVTLQASGVISCQAGLDASEADSSWCDLLLRRVGVCVQMTGVGVTSC